MAPTAARRPTGPPGPDGVVGTVAPMTVLAVANQKGGVGKTTVALGLAAAASGAGRRVLVVDLDPQANATTGLGVWDATTTVDDALAVDRPGAIEATVTTVGWPAGAGPVPELSPSTPALAGREVQLATDAVGAQDRLRTALKGTTHDLVIIDCPPSLGLLTVNGLVAADRVVVVSEPAAWASDGVAQMLRTIDRVRDRQRTELTVAGIVVNRLGRTRDARYWHDQLVETYGDLVVGPIHLRAAIAEASAQSLPLHALGQRPGAETAAQEFADLLAQVLPDPSEDS